MNFNFVISSLQHTYGLFLHILSENYEDLHVIIMKLMVITISMNFFIFLDFIFEKIYFLCSTDDEKFPVKRGKKEIARKKGYEDITSCRLRTLKNIFPPTQNCYYCAHIQCFMIIVPVLHVYVQIFLSFIYCKSLLCAIRFFFCVDLERELFLYSFYSVIWLKFKSCIQLMTKFKGLQNYSFPVEITFQESFNFIFHFRR